MLCGGLILGAWAGRILISDKNTDEWPRGVAQEATGAHPEGRRPHCLTSINLRWRRTQRINCPLRVGPKIAPADKGIANRVALKARQLRNSPR